MTYGTAIGGDSIRISQRSLASDNYIPCAIMWSCLRNPMFSHFNRTPIYNRRTNKQQRMPC